MSKAKSQASLEFAAKYGNLYPLIEGRNECFINATNPHAEEIIAEMKKRGATIGINYHDIGESLYYGGGEEPTYAGQKPVWVFLNSGFTKSEFTKWLKKYKSNNVPWNTIDDIEEMRSNVLNENSPFA